MILNNIKKKILKNINLIYIKTAKIRIKNKPYSQKGLDILKKYKICFVKQETYNDLYTVISNNKKTLLYSTIHRSGPIGLCEAKNFEFKIIKITETEESNVWKYLEEDVGGDNFYTIKKFKDTIFKKKSGAIINTETQATNAISALDVNWNEYDIVISINFSIDESIVKKYNNVLWCYMPQEPSQRHYKNSTKYPLFSYDLFLNQKFSFDLKKEIKNKTKIIKTHEINFPYNFLNSTIFEDLENFETYERKGIYIENHSLWHITNQKLKKLDEIGGFNHPEEEPYEIILKKMLKSKYFLSLRNNDFKIWGNSMIDSVATGLLSFGNPDEYLNIGLFTPFTCIKSFEEFKDKIYYLEANNNFYLKELKIQQGLLDKYCYYRPLIKLEKALINKRKSIK